LTNRKTSRFDQARRTITTSIRCTEKRIQATKGAAMPCCTRYLALVSRKENRNPAARMSRMAELGAAASGVLLFGFNLLCRKGGEASPVHRTMRCGTQVQMLDQT